jgi:DNA-binding PucR family transcriptional regulator
MELTMELRTYADILALHTTVADAFQKRVEKLKDELPKSDDGFLAGKRGALKAAKEAAASVERARKEANRRFDAELARRSGEVEKLAREIEALEKTAKEKTHAKTEESPAAEAAAQPAAKKKSKEEKSTKEK